jgi:predicted DNA-binding transcriptional regulator AlpA
MLSGNARDSFAGNGKSEYDRFGAINGSANPLRLVRSKELRQMIGWSHATFWRLVNEGRLPMPVRIGERTKAWKLSNINAWLERLGRVG